MFTISKINGQVRITKPSGISVSGTYAVITEVDSSIIVTFTGEKDIIIPLGMIKLIDGNEPSGDLSVVANQIRAVFNAVSGAGNVPSFDGQLKQNNSAISTSNPLPVNTVSTGVPFGMSATTGNPGSTPVAFSNQPCSSLTLINDSPTVDIEYQANATGAYVRVLARSFWEIDNITNANQIRIRRADQSNTPVTITAEARI